MSSGVSTRSAARGGKEGTQEAPPVEVRARSVSGRVRARGGDEAAQQQTTSPAAKSTKKSKRDESLLSTEGQPQLPDSVIQVVVQQAAVEERVAAEAALLRQQEELLRNARIALEAAQRSSPKASPGASPARLVARRVADAAPRNSEAEPAVAAAAAAIGAPAARRAPQPKLSDLSTYDGSSGAKLDEWLQDLRRCRRFFQLEEREAVEFALVHFRGAADTWWESLSQAEQDAASASVDALTAALRERFQPITQARTARDQLRKLQQGTRPVDSYIADFNQLHAKIKDMSEADARSQFVYGLRKEIADKIEDDDWEEMPLAKLIAKAARIGNRASAASATAQPRAAISQMETDEVQSLEERVQRAVLHALGSQQSQSVRDSASSASSGLGAKTQTQRGYDSDRSRGSMRGGGRGGGPGRFGNRPPRSTPGVPPALVEQRRAAGLCVRCGGEHMQWECANATNTQPLN